MTLVQKLADGKSVLQDFHRSALEELRAGKDELERINVEKAGAELEAKIVLDGFPSLPELRGLRTSTWELASDLREVVLEEAQIEIQLAPLGWVRATDVSQVRAGSGTTTVVVDFQGMQTISGVGFVQPNTSPKFRLNGIAYWDGQKFGEEQSFATPKGLTLLDERFTQKVALKISAADGSSVSVSAVTQRLVVQLPGPPQSAELRLGDTTVWTRPGELPLDESGRFLATVDVTAILRSVLADPESRLQFELRTHLPCQHSYTQSLKFLRRAQLLATNQDLDISPTTPAFRAPQFAFDLGPEAHLIQALEIDIDIEADHRRWFSLHQATPDAALALDLNREHATIEAIDPQTLDGLETLHAIWLPVRALGSDAELRIEIYVGDSVHPGANVSFSSESVSLSPGAKESWVRFPLAEAITLADVYDPTTDILWIALHCDRGLARRELARSLVAATAFGRLHRFDPFRGEIRNYELKFGGQYRDPWSRAYAEGDVESVERHPALRFFPTGDEPSALSETPRSSIRVELVAPEATAPASTLSPITVPMQIFGPGKFVLNRVTALYRKNFSLAT